MDKDGITAKVKKLGYPVIVKPATLGSSVGITFVKDEKDLDKAITEAINYDVKIIVEAAVQNLVEVNCSVFGNYSNQETSVIEEVTTDEEFLTYADKYTGGSKGKLKGGSSKGMASASRIIPARISDKLQKEVEETSKKAFRLLNLSGVCRIDYLIDKKANKLYINEPNTIIVDLPGFGESNEPDIIWTMYDYAECIHELLKSLKVKNPILVGHSFGGKISLIYASK